jgi:hypothetical protein
MYNSTLSLTAALDGGWWLRTADSNFTKRISDHTDCVHRHARKSLETYTGAVEKAAYSVFATGQFCCFAFFFRRKILMLLHLHKLMQEI